jgi:hypothetical protein
MPYLRTFEQAAVSDITRDAGKGPANLIFPTLKKRVVCFIFNNDGLFSRKAGSRI